MNIGWNLAAGSVHCCLRGRGQGTDEVQPDMQFRWNLMSLVREFELQGPVEDSMNVNRGVAL